ncbi:hypothetical protein MPTK1_7g08160 [Marchantia polymorpha subsp. ruderalis]|nr:hypothetical protein MARPO_0146s0016 [Marchantia polymorpha]BBN16647.1 hypothetical protein Mp_7g08160 [Marchantia polymorpha subsp. ruderalis]|eukprot:PTQ29194.1 hypothetical protein MARPO_0146s0016 [Marchantia polymorpha]
MSRSRCSVFVAVAILVDGWFPIEPNLHPFPRIIPYDSVVGSGSLSCDSDLPLLAWVSGSWILSDDRKEMRAGKKVVCPSLPCHEKIQFHPLPLSKKRDTTAFLE